MAAQGTEEQENAQAWIVSRPSKTAYHPRLMPHTAQVDELAGSNHHHHHHHNCALSSRTKRRNCPVRPTGFFGSFLEFIGIACVELWSLVMQDWRHEDIDTKTGVTLTFIHIYTDFNTETLLCGCPDYHFVNIVVYLKNPNISASLASQFDKSKHEMLIFLNKILHSPAKL